VNTPWELSTAAIDIIGQVCKSKTIIEFGAGRGTERLIDAGFTVYSIEHDPQWACSRAASTLIAPIVNRWYDHDRVAAYLSGISAPIGAVIIDGPIGRIGRWGVLHHWRQLNQAEAIIVDDVHRPDEFGIACALVSITRRNMTIHGHDDKSFALLRGPN
jgi:hypothetical protein